MDIYVCVYPHNYFCLKKIRKNFGGIKKNLTFATVILKTIFLP
ncbi:hypothetical protein SAMN04487850_0050 [Prevotella aff. ruminicola Tc2-24]|uniref:Uncharacterized protein n=1 Tax=Prevotella aff. ruminicola Tc2-24 TaxID=81582 RepID=A0A1I0LXG8_9BACT|nr:hypothetical protein SAMN04487850_0050 [Prevotella aff. ruminicola Tc2-24]